ncbi:MAG: hypothetical protein AB1510_11600, partial [Bacillota bacterium]
QTHLPLWIRRLCFDPEATRQLSFPAGDSTYVPGWDGVLYSEQGNAWVPAGASRWEIGCDQDVRGKANDEYRKRTEQTSGEERSACTFVFVIPRRWTKKSSAFSPTIYTGPFPSSPENVPITWPKRSPFRVNTGAPLLASGKGTLIWYMKNPAIQPLHTVLSATT